MTKLLSLIVFIGAFVWTWFLFNSNKKISQATHAGIQSKLMLLIEETIKKSRPNSSHFVITKMYTQELDENQVSARFSYQYTDQLEAATTTIATPPSSDASTAATPHHGSVQEPEQKPEPEQINQSMSGEAILYRSLSENPNADKWVIKSVKTESSGLEFLQGTTVNSEDLGSGAPNNTSTPTELPTEKKTE